LGLHEVVETTGINGRVTGRNLFAVALVEPNLEEVFCFLLNIVCLKVVNNRNMVDILSILRDELVPSVVILPLKFFNEY
jgi:hypothetical protein